MSDPVQNFEFILQKRCNNKPSALYSDVKNLNKHTYNPKDVISSVSSQLKAIYSADCMKSNKRVARDLKKVKKSMFLSVNNLPVSDDQPPKNTAKFDTQCVTDTQLINIIEDAEIQDTHIGMTQEFETAFIHSNIENENKNNENCDLGDNFQASIPEAHQLKDMAEVTEKIEHIDEDIVNKEHIKISNRDNHIKNTDKTVITNEASSNEITINSNPGEELHCFSTQVEQFSQILQTKTVNNKHKTKEADDFNNKCETQVEFSQILQTKTVNNKFKKNEAASDGDSDIQDTAIEECSELLNQCIEIEDNENTERPPSPIFISKHVKIKSKTPSPLVFNLDKFEHFESIAISLLETHDFNTTRHLINSQILNKELHLKIDDDIEFNDREIYNTDFEKKEDEIESLGSPIIDRDIEVMEIDKEISDDILKQLNKQNAGAKAETTSDVFKDEILFSSDEEDNYIHKEYQDLPFTYALETSFYNQSDVLDKNMYVGFQTASNRSIQVCADSFAKAKSILSDVDDDVTVSELVKNCESEVKNKSAEEHAKIYLSEKSTEMNLTKEKSDIPVTDVSNKSIKAMNKEMSNVSHLKTYLDKNNLIGFMTANNKKINLSQKALARCKKVFQDIDLKENFDCANENLQEMDLDCDENLKEIKIYSDGTKKQNTNAKINPIDDVLEGIDEDIIQEFENIEMSLKDDTQEETELIISSKSMQILENVSKDYDAKSKENALKKNLDMQETVLSQIIGNPNSKTANTNIGFKTASNKNINISEQAWVKSKNVFDNLDAIELPKKTEKVMGKVDINKLDIVKPMTSKHKFVDFKTANNKDINISDQALEQTRYIFKDIDSAEELSKISKDIPEENNDKMNTEIINQPSTSKGFVGFKSANNKNIKISKEAWTRSKNIFNNIDATELPKKENKIYPEERHEIKNMNQESPFNKPDDMSVGFQTANHKNIHISAEALVKTKGIFNDIDATDGVIPEKLNKDSLDANATENVEHMEIDSKRVECMEFAGFKSASNKIIKVSEKALDQTKNFFKELDSNDLEVAKEMLNEKDVVEVANEIVCETGFVGFKTANNKNIKISNEALAKTKNIFKDLGEIDVKQGHKTKAHYPDIEINPKTTESNQLLINKNEANKTSIQETNAPEFKGFKTASNKPLKVTSEALIKTKNIFKDIHINNDCNIEDNINEEKYLYPKELINNEPTSPVFKGFQTANKKPVAVSAKALEKGKIFFEDIDNQNLNFTGFQTASNKQVKISEKALANSRNIFKDIAINDGFNVLSKIVKEKGLYPEEILQEKIDEADANLLLNKEVKDTALPFKGFQTASKKPVAISESALEKSKKIFQNLDTNNDNTELEICGNKIQNDKVNVESLMKTNKEFTVDTPKSYSFLGFQTASDKKVIVSEDALAKSKKLFQDIDNIENEKAQKDIVKKHSNYQIGFQTGNNKSIGVSDEAIARSKRLFSEIDEETANTIKKSKKAMENDEVHAIIDTQVLNNFEQSLYTDFQKSPQNNKRSGSPILSCPRAKKRKKFETPYNIKNIPKPTPLLKETDEKETKKITFNHDFKKNKKYTLKELNNMSINMTKNLDPYLLNFKYDNLLQFEFKDNRNDVTESLMTSNILKELFINSVNSKLVPQGWVENHMTLILWKLISYEVKFKSVICTARNVLDQLKYRYDKELYNAQRPALRKIFERDDVPSKTMVLCVVEIYIDGVKVSSIPNTASNVELMLTDGWYCIRCNIDKMLIELVCSGSITVGSKIVTSGAELTGCEQGVSPLEDTSAVRLKIFGNSTRRARWDARLGYHGNTAILCQLSSVKVLGGKVSKLRVYVTRVYPALYVEKFEDGSTVTRSERLENLHQMKTEAERQAFMEKLYEEVEREFADQESQDSEGLSDSYKRTCMDSGSQIAKMMKRSKDPAEYRAQLTDSQLNLLEAHTTKSRDKLLQDIQTRVRDRVEKAGVCGSRNVVCLLKIRVAGVSDRGDGVCVTKGMMSIWKPNDAIQEIIKEGAWIDVLNVVPTAVRYSEIQISAGRQSIFSTSKMKEPEKFKSYIKLLQRQCYPLKDLAQTPYLSTDYNEIDTVGLIFSIEPSIKEFDSTKQSFQNLYLSDAEKNIICVNFWGGLKKFGFQNVLDTGQVIACVNLQKRAGNTRKNIPHFRVTEFSYFTQTPKFDNARIMVSDLNKKLNGLDRRKFCQECVVLKNNYSFTKNNENVSPYRFMNTDINISKNKIFIDSPLTRQNKIEENFNLTGLDFESTFKQDSELSEEMLQRKKKVNEKIARLKMYGEPPPLSPLHIINRSKQACSSYKSPLLSNNNNSKIDNYKNQLGSKSDSYINVATVNNTPQKCVESEISNSPVVLNRTYVKSVNPIRINFDVQDNNDSKVDHFGDEFEGSPPLSLD